MPPFIGSISPSSTMPSFVVKELLLPFAAVHTGDVNLSAKSYTWLADKTNHLDYFLNKPLYVVTRSSTSEKLEVKMRRSTTTLYRVTFDVYYTKGTSVSSQFTGLTLEQMISEHFQYLFAALDYLYKFVWYLQTCENPMINNDVNSQFPSASIRNSIVQHFKSVFFNL
jgi:hypothetical protein